MSKKRGSKTKESITPVETGPIRMKMGRIQLQLNVKPGARVSKIAEIDEHSIGVQIAAPPRDGEANEEVIRFFAEIFSLRPRDVELIVGGKSRDKLVQLENPQNLTIESIESILMSNRATG